MSFRVVKEFSKILKLFTSSFFQRTAHTINVVPGNKNARLLPQPQDVKRGDWEVLVGDNKWAIQSNVSINSLQR